LTQSAFPDRFSGAARLQQPAASASVLSAWERFSLRISDNAFVRQHAGDSSISRGPGFEKLTWAFGPPARDENQIEHSGISLHPKAPITANIFRTGTAARKI
jgi:hypothetical protein